MSELPTFTSRVLFDIATRQMRKIEESLAEHEKIIRTLQSEHASLYAIAKAYDDGNRHDDA